MRQRLLENKLLVYYLGLAEAGDSDAKKKAQALARTMFQATKPHSERYAIEVHLPTGQRATYHSLAEASRRLKITETAICQCYEENRADPEGRRYQFIFTA